MQAITGIERVNIREIKIWLYSTHFYSRSLCDWICTKYGIAVGITGVIDCNKCFDNRLRGPDCHKLPFPR